MFFILSKIAYFFIHPFSWLIVAVLLAFFTKRPRLKKVARWSAVFVLLFFSNSFVFKEFIRLWEVETVQITKESSYDVAIVLGGMFEYDETAKRISARRGADRIWQALDLYHKGVVKKLFISGDHGYVSDRGLHEAQQIKDALVNWGIPETDIITENSSRNTHENALESSKILRQSYPHFDSFLLVTSSHHMRRAKACFEKQNIQCDVYPTDQFTGGKRFYNWDEYFIPNVDNFGYWFALIKEWVGFTTYAIMGYI